jgi:hypothetical protein
MTRKKKPALKWGESGSEAELETSEGIPVSETTPELENVVKPTAEVAKPVKPKANRTGITLDIFVRISGKKWDQMAGFRQYAINHGLKRMDTKDWHREYQKFLSLPV